MPECRYLRTANVQYVKSKKMKKVKTKYIKILVQYCNDDEIDEICLDENQMRQDFENEIDKLHDEIYKLNNKTE